MRERISKNIFITSMTVFLVCIVFTVCIFCRTIDESYQKEVNQYIEYMTACAETENLSLLETVANKTSFNILLCDSEGNTLYEKKYDGQLSQDRKNEISRELSNGYVLTVYAEKSVLPEVVSRVLLPLSVVFCAAIIISLLFAIGISDFIVKPVEKFDVENPDSRDVYKELKPFVTKIQQQNKLLYYQGTEMKKATGQQEDMRREFTANVSHELKTPLTAISGIAEIMCGGIVKAEDIPHFAENIYKETQRLITLVEDIIKLSQMDEDAVPNADEKIDLYEVSCDVVQRLEGYAQSKGVSVSVAGGSAEITGAAKIVEEMIYNLCDNAIKYNRQGGTAVISVEENAENAAVSVKDSGIGIPKEELGRIFERFYRVDKSHSKEIGGTGLGLSIVKHGALFHGAKISVDSRLGEGTMITVKFKKQ